LFNLRLSGIAGALAFIISLLLGIISGTRIPVVLLRALIFAVVFAVLSGGIYVLISLYLPDLLSPPDAGSGGFRDALGSNVDISVDDAGEDGLSAGYFRGGDENLTEFGENQDLSNENIDTLSGDGLDQNGEEGYTMGGETGTPAAGLEPLEPVGSTEPVGSSEPKGSTELDSSSEASVSEAPAEELPDFDRMATAFGEASLEIPGIGDTGPAPPSTGGPPPAEFNAQFVGGSMNKKTPDMADDFDIKEMASAIQTILVREDKG
jgi:hypothetical protein